MSLIVVFLFYLRVCEQDFSIFKFGYGQYCKRGVITKLWLEWKNMLVHNSCLIWIYAFCKYIGLVCRAERFNLVDSVALYTSSSDLWLLFCLTFQGSSSVAILVYRLLQLSFYWLLHCFFFFFFFLLFFLLQHLGQGMPWDVVSLE